MSAILNALQDLLSEETVLEPDMIAKRATSFWNGNPMQGSALVRAGSTEDVSAVLKLCNERGQSVITHGGLTNCASSAVSGDGDVILSLERMNQIEEIDIVAGTATVQAGVVLETLQNAVADKGMYFPLDLGAKGSCTLGGNAATNAGGLNVIRYGMMRNLILGMEVVLADGTVLSSMNRMLKNNAGYDLKHMFIGSEGTLGIITRLIVRLEPKPISTVTALVATDTFDHVPDLLNHFKSSMGGTLCAFEAMWGGYFRAVTAEGFHRAPMDRDYPFYLLVECQGTDQETDHLRFMAALEDAFEKAMIVDAVIPKSETERKELWAVRENFAALLVGQLPFLYDVSLPITDMKTYVEEVEARVHGTWEKGEVYTLGHVGDGNLHFFVAPGEGDQSLHAVSDACVYEPLEKYGGSVSAEHGIGTEKKGWLSTSRTDAEIALMRTLKKSLDPNSILNPGIIFDL